jgi:hypothetical protein
MEKKTWVNPVVLEVSEVSLAEDVVPPSGAMD